MEQQYANADAEGDYAAIVGVARTGIAALNGIGHFILGAKLLEQQAREAEAQAPITALPEPAAPTLCAALKTLVESGALLPSYRSTIGDEEPSESAEGATDGNQQIDSAS